MVLQGWQGIIAFPHSSFSYSGKFMELQFMKLKDKFIKNNKKVGKFTINQGL